MSPIQEAHVGLVHDDVTEAATSGYLQSVLQGSQELHDSFNTGMLGSHSGNLNNMLAAASKNVGHPQQVSVIPFPLTSALATSSASPPVTPGYGFGPPPSYEQHMSALEQRHLPFQQMYQQHNQIIGASNSDIKNWPVGPNLLNSDTSFGSNFDQTKSDVDTSLLVPVDQASLDNHCQGGISAAAFDVSEQNSTTVTGFVSSKFTKDLMENNNVNSVVNSPQLFLSAPVSSATSAVSVHNQITRSSPSTNEIVTLPNTSNETLRVTNSSPPLASTLTSRHGHCQETALNPPLSPISESSSGVGNNLSDGNTRSVSAAVSDESVAGDSGVFEASVRRLVCLFCVCVIY